MLTPHAHSAEWESRQVGAVMARRGVPLLNPARRTEASFPQLGLIHASVTRLATRTSHL